MSIKTVWQKAGFKTWLVVFALGYCALRVPWLDTDPGIPSQWEYGYNATDEGYYLDGGKEKYLWGTYVDLPRGEAFTYGFSPLTHNLSYLAHRCFGLSTWTWRIPFALVTFLAYLALFTHVSRRIGPGCACATLLAATSLPMVVAYERTASNDVLIGSLLILAYTLAAGRGAWRIFVSALVAGAIVLVKPSVWVLLPIVAAGILETRKTRAVWFDVALFAVASLVAVGLWRGAAWLSVLPDAARAGVTAGEIITRTTTHYPLPKLFDFASHFKGLSCFPRDPSITMLGVAALFITAFPVALAAKDLAHGRFRARTLLFLAVPAYVAAVSVMNTIYTHYFLPVVMIIPVLLAAAAEAHDEDGAAAESAKTPWHVRALVFGLTLVALVAFLASLGGATDAPQAVQDFYSRIYNHPAKNVWLMTWPHILVFAALVTALAAFARGRAQAMRYGAVWFVCAAVGASVVFAALPAVRLAKYLRVEPGVYFAPLALNLAVAAFFFVALFALSGRGACRRTLVCALVACLALGLVATPNGRQAAEELLRPGTRHHARAARELAACLPQDAIVIGERSNQMLMSLPVRTATTFAANSDPIPVIEAILAAEPDAKLFALADSQHAYNLQHYREHQGEYALRPVKTLRMPSFSSGRLADVHLLRIYPLSRARRPSPSP